MGIAPAGIDWTLEDDIEITVNYYDNTINNKVNSTNDTAEGEAAQIVF